MKPHNIKLTPAAREAALALAKDGYLLKFRALQQGCCTLSVRIVPVPDLFQGVPFEKASLLDAPGSPPASDAADKCSRAKTSDAAVLSVDGVRILMDDSFPDFTWVGTIDYKEKGLHKGFHWR